MSKNLIPRKTLPRLESLSPFYVMELLARAKAMERAGRDVVHMEIGEPDFPTPPCVVEAGIEALRTDKIHYTTAAGLPELREAIALHYRERCGVSLDCDRIIVTPGASGALLLLLSALVEQGDEVLLEDPGYPCYANFVRILGGCVGQVPVGSEDGFHLTAAMADSQWGPRTRGLLLASPANPTGAVMPKGHLAELVELANVRDGFLVVDEIYQGLEYGTRSHSALEFSPQAFVVNSFSKYYGMTGWRLGWAVVPEDYAELAQRIAQNIFIAAPTHSQLAALAAFSAANGEELQRRREVFRSRRDFLVNALLDLGFSLPTLPEGAFYVYADCSRFTDDSFDFAWRLLETVGVAVTPGKDFGVNQPERFLRFAYTTSMERLETGVQRIEGFLREFGG